MIQKGGAHEKARDLIVGTHRHTVASSESEVKDAFDLEGRTRQEEYLAKPEDQRAAIIAAGKDEARELELKNLDTRFDPGSWYCGRCGNAYFGETLECGAYIPVGHKGVSDEERRNLAPGKTQVLCRGSQATTWGGYVHSLDQLPDKVLGRGPSRLSRGVYKRGNQKDRAQAKIALTAEELAGTVTEER